MIFSPSKNLFYAPEFKKEYKKAGSWPDDAITVSDSVYAEFKEDKEGFVRSVGQDGMPIWEAKVIPKPTNEDIKTLRRVRYADPLEGSDVLYNEALRNQMQGDKKAYEETLQKAQQRYEAIKASLPYSDKE